ncbi:hypothetical protein CCR75_000309 [Bremia lactucae]|uniref:Uncharacterized protein n=1 Tax=Bremia lactucae TaxID=4779 RepID=A0A976FL85_BRELC|nr:hypothetical protein CCR75_000309 [Bremia lactucae]
MDRTKRIVDDFQVLSETEWQRLRRVGLQLTPDANSKESFCFQNVPSSDGLSVRVLRLLRESQYGTTEIQTWMDAAMRREHGECSSKLAAEKTPPRQNIVTAGKISPEEMQKRRHISFDDEAQKVESEYKTDGMRLRSLMRSLSPRRKEQNAFKISTSLLESGSACYFFNSERHDQLDTSGDSEEFKKNISDAPSLFLDSKVVSLDALNEVDSDDMDRYNNQIILKRDIFQKFGLCVGENQRTGNASYHEAFRSAATILKCFFEWAAKRAFAMVQNNLEALFETLTDRDFCDYDLLWTEEEGYHRWTMFGEPRGWRQRGRNQDNLKRGSNGYEEI